MSSDHQEQDEVRQRLAVALDSAGIGSWELDTVCGEFTGDAKTLEMFGFPADSKETRLGQFARRLSGEDRARVGRALDVSVAEGTDYAEEYQVKLSDGSVRWVAARGRPMYDAGGEVRGPGRGCLRHHGEPRRRCSWHPDPAGRHLVGQFARHRLEGREDHEGSLRPFSSRQPFLANARAINLALRTLRSQAAIDAILALDAAAIAVFPLLTDAGEVIGLITLVRGSGRPAFSDAEMEATVDLCGRASSALENAQSFGREREMSEQLQRSMLTEPVQPPHVEVVVRYLAASKAAQVGGD